MFTLLSSVSEPEDIVDRSSTQNRAFNWLIFDDPAQVCPDEILNVTQRYVLALLYYSTNGNDWSACNSADANVVAPCGDAGGRTRFLDEANVCLWFLNDCNGDTLTSIRLGTKLIHFLL